MDNNNKKHNIKSIKRRALQFGEIPGLAKLPVPYSLKPIEGEVFMWRCVIDQAISDLINMDDSTKAKKNRKEAEDWLNGVVNDPEAESYDDFEEVCAMAYIRPEHVRKWVRKVVDESRLQEPE